MPFSFVTFCWIWIGFALILLPIQLWVTAPYGRHANLKWGPSIPNRLGWMLMEIVSPLFLWWQLWPVRSSLPLPVWLLAGWWTFHYINRSLIFPLRIRTQGKRIPVLIVLFALCFNLVNGTLNGYYLANHLDAYSMQVVTAPHFIIGLVLLCMGAGINLWSDEKLLHLRKPGETGYKIPHGGLFRRISCPNHLGEILEWCGFALAAWNLPALTFAIWTISNLVPRALSHHRWYRQHFATYPANRKAIIPYLL
jgi:3-oxo-5-alpha-steroid 4-dehydrogenase 1